MRFFLQSSSSASPLPFVKSAITATREAWKLGLVAAAKKKESAQHEISLTLCGARMLRAVSVAKWRLEV
jgi:hypothetical protein